MVGDTELGQGVRDRLECATLRGTVLLDKVWKGSRPRATPCRQRRPVQLQEAAMDAATPLGHGPMREPLLEIACQEPNERCMDPGIGVETVHLAQPVTMPNRHHRRGARRFAGTADRLDA